MARMLARTFAGVMVVGVAAAAGVAQSGPMAPVVVAFAEKTSAGAGVERRWDAGAWTPGTPVWSTASGIAWQELRVAPDWTRMALARVEWSGAARLSLWDGSAWGPAQQLTANAGTGSSKVAAVAFEHASGDALAVYRTQNNTTLRYRTHSGSLSAEGTISGLTLNAAPRWITLASKRRSDEVVMLVATSSRLYGAVWDGSAWGSAVTLETSLASGGRAFDVAYMSGSGQALAVWGPSSGAPKSRVWTGLAWGTATTLASAGADVRWLELAASPAGSSDEVLLATLDTARDVNLNRWDGLAWGGFTEVTTSAAATDEPRVDVAYQPDGAGALAVWHESGQTALRYRTWNGVAWSSTQVGPDMGMATYRVELSPGAQGDEVVMAARGYTPGGAQDYVLYTTEGNVEPNSTVVNGPTGEAVPGVNLPAAPAGGSGGGNVSYGNNQTVTLTPGTRKKLSFGNSCTANLGPGVYRYESLEAGNTLTMNFNTDGGDITFILTNGNLQSDNNETFLNTGSGRATIVLLNGDFQLKNNAKVKGSDVVAYNGNIEIGNNAAVEGLLHAKGNVIIGSGVVDPPSYFWSGAGRVSAVVWEGGVPGARVDLTSDPAGAPAGGAMALSDRPPAARRRITGWAEVDPTE